MGEDGYVGRTYTLRSLTLTVRSAPGNAVIGTLRIVGMDGVIGSLRVTKAALKRDWQRA